MKNSYDDIIEAIFYYTSSGKYDELYAIISLLDRYAIPQIIIEQLKGDLQYLFDRQKESKQSYKEAAMMYQRSGEIKKSEALLKAIAQMNKLK